MAVAPMEPIRMFMIVPDPANDVVIRVNQRSSTE
jgi:hypothetical protein